MEALSRWQRRAVSTCIILLLLWFCGFSAMQMRRQLHPAQDLSLRTIARLELGSLEAQPLADGAGGIVLQEHGGRLIRLGSNGGQLWKVDTPSHFFLMSVQQGEGFLVLTDRYGKALAVNDDGTELWRFEPDHQALHSERPQFNPGHASFYTMAGCLVYGLDERGGFLWQQRIRSATSIATARPFMLVNEDGELVTYANNGRIRVSSQGEMTNNYCNWIWQTRQRETGPAGRILENYGLIQIANSRGETIADDMGEQLGYGISLDSLAWLTEGGFAQLQGEPPDMAYIRFDGQGEVLRRQYYDSQPVADVGIGGDQLLLWRAQGLFPRLQGLHAMLLQAMRSGDVNFDYVEAQSPGMGGMSCTLETAPASLQVQCPAWLQEPGMRLYGFGDDAVLAVDGKGRGRVARLESAR